VSQPTVSQNGASATSDAGSLVIVWKPPDNPSENVFVFTFGGARVSVAATPGDPAFSEEVLESVDDAVGGTDLAPDGGGADLGGDVALPPATDGGLVSEPGGTRTAGFSLADTFAGFGWGWLLLLLVVAALAGAGNRRLMTDLLDRPGTTCPLERDA
jgi:hypothetical protein